MSDEEPLADFARQGATAGKAAAERDYQQGEKPERWESFEALYDDAWTVAQEASTRSGIPYGDALKLAEEAFVDAFMGAYTARAEEFTAEERRANQ